MFIIINFCLFLLNIIVFFKYLKFLFLLKILYYKFFCIILFLNFLILVLNLNLLIKSFIYWYELFFINKILFWNLLFLITLLTKFNYFYYQYDHYEFFLLNFNTGGIKTYDSLLINYFYTFFTLSIWFNFFLYLLSKSNIYYKKILLIINLFFILYFIAYNFNLIVLFVSLVIGSFLIINLNFLFISKLNYSKFLLVKQFFIKLDIVHLKIINSFLKKQKYFLK